MSSDSSSNNNSDDERDNDDVAVEHDIFILNRNGLAVAAAQKLVSDNPLRSFLQNCKGKVKATADHSAVVDYLESLFLLPQCFSKHSNRFEQCSCLVDIRENIVIEVVADRLSKYCFC